MRIAKRRFVAFPNATRLTASIALDLAISCRLDFERNDHLSGRSASVTHQGLGIDNERLQITFSNDLASRGSARLIVDKNLKLSLPIGHLLRFCPLVARLSDPDEAMVHRRHG